MVKLLFLSFWLALHPVHVSLLSIDHVPEEEKFDVFLRVYFDDFLLDSGINNDDQKKLSFSGNNLFTREVILKYINSKLEIIVNGRQISAELINTDLSDNELRMSLVFGQVKNVKTIIVKNSIMTSLYSDQVNMTIVKIKDFEEGVKLTSEETEKTFRIN
jgi:hypothetical protein